MPEQSLPLPDHAYVPGVTVRHSEDAFAHIRDTAKPGMSDDAIAQSAAFQAGLVYRASGFYWEAHEVLEPVWMVCALNSDARALVQAIIQLANAQLKLVMEMPNATKRLCDIAKGHLDSVSAARILGCDLAALYTEISELRNIASEL